MSFKDNLKDELTYQGILVKELSAKTGIAKRTIDNYLRSNESQPTAENAVKIAKALNVTVEYLVTGKNDNTKQSDSLGIELPLCKKYYRIIKKFETVQEESVKQIEALIEQMK